jgi:hypothetical protein
MCRGALCPQKDTCYRFTAKPSENQWWAGFDSIRVGNCEAYLAVRVVQTRETVEEK